MRMIKIFLLAGKHTGRDPHESFTHIPKGENYDWSQKHIMVCPIYIFKMNNVSQNISITE